MSQTSENNYEKEQQEIITAHSQKKKKYQYKLQINLLLCSTAIPSH